MKNDARQSIARFLPRRSNLFYGLFEGLFCGGILVALSLGGCSTVPDWSNRETRHTSLTILYQARAEVTQIQLPGSTDALLIEALAIDPVDLPQSFHQGQRHLLLPAGDQTVTVRCRYRLFRRHDADGNPRPWRSPRELFPGASQIQQHQ